MFAGVSDVWFRDTQSPLGRGRVSSRGSLRLSSTVTEVPLTVGSLCFFFFSRRSNSRDSLVYHFFLLMFLPLPFSTSYSPFFPSPSLSTFFPTPFVHPFPLLPFRSLPSLPTPSTFLPSSPPPSLCSFCPSPLPSPSLPLFPRTSLPSLSLLLPPRRSPSLFCFRDKRRSQTRPSVPGVVPSGRQVSIFIRILTSKSTSNSRGPLTEV